MRMNEVWQRRSGLCVCVCACLLCTCLPSCSHVAPLPQSLAVEPKDSLGTLAAERPGGWIEPCRLGYYQYRPSRQPGRQEMEPTDLLCLLVDC